MTEASGDHVDGYSGEQDHRRVDVPEIVQPGRRQCLGGSRFVVPDGQGCVGAGKAGVSAVR
ncbi:hypothetical protein GCM10010151_43670 [Actinoallomurus spadix]|uniref:Uncharacterized protein n=1 Tax=Actinoallomurus spadix TaxID=79912 RepID=A0ABP3GPW9_9ACTN